MTFYSIVGSPGLITNFTFFKLTSNDNLYIFDGPNTSSPEVAGSPFSSADSPGEIASTNTEGALTFRFKSAAFFDEAGWEADIYSTVISAVDVAEKESITDYALFANYPNPFNPKTVISYQLPVNSSVNLEVYNVIGQKVSTLVNQKQTAGKYQVHFDAAALASGVYIYKLQAGNFVRARKMLLIR